MVRDAGTTLEVLYILERFYPRDKHPQSGAASSAARAQDEKGRYVMGHFLEFDELYMSMQSIDDEISRDEQIVILLQSLSDEYDQILNIMENIREMDLFAKEMPCREYECIARERKKENSR